MTDAAVPADFEVIYVAKVGSPLCSGWLRAEDRTFGNPQLTYRATILASNLPPGAKILTPAEVEAW